MRGTPENFSVPSFFHVAITYEYYQRLMMQEIDHDFMAPCAFNSYCRAPFNLVVGLLARMLLGFFNHFVKMHQNC